MRGFPVTRLPKCQHRLVHRQESCAGTQALTVCLLTDCSLGKSYVQVLILAPRGTVGVLALRCNLHNVEGRWFTRMLQF